MESNKDVPDFLAQQLKEEEFLRNQLSVTSVDYSEAVLHLVDMARRDTSASGVAAQVLLSLYNGRNWHLDLTDLCLLDYQYLQSAFIAIRGRVMLSVEPQDMIENGTDIFSELEKQWQHLHTSKRYLDM